MIKPPNDQQLDTLIGHNIKNIRLLAGMSQKDLALLVGLSFQQIQKYENGNNRILCSRLYAIAQALSVDIEKFYQPPSLPQKHKYLQAAEPLKKTLHPPKVAPELKILIKEFENIKDKALRRSIIALVRSIAANEEKTSK